MTLYGGWREGRADAWLKNIPPEEQCTHCHGKGEEMTKHTFGVGYSYWPCSVCGGSGKKDTSIDGDKSKSDCV